MLYEDEEMSITSQHCDTILNVPMLHDVQVPQLHHFLLSFIDICELIQLLQVEKNNNKTLTNYDKIGMMLQEHIQ